MNNNRLKHKLLTILFNEYSVEKLQNSYSVRPVGLTFKEICEKLNISLTKLEEISFGLMEEKEVEKFSLDDDGFIIGERGLEAYSEKNI